MQCLPRSLENVQGLTLRTLLLVQVAVPNGPVAVDEQLVTEGPFAVRTVAVGIHSAFAPLALHTRLASTQSAGSETDSVYMKPGSRFGCEILRRRWEETSPSRSSPS